MAAYRCALLAFALLFCTSVRADDLRLAIHADQVLKAAATSATKEITPGCLTTPIPTTPTGPTWTFEANTFTSSSPRIVRGTFWRKPCSTPGDAQLILTFTVVQGVPFVCTSGPVLIQNSQQTSNFFFDTSPNSTTLDTFCGDLFVPTSVVIDERSTSFTFDDDAPFTFVFEGVTTNVGGYDPAAYGQTGLPRPIAGKLSGSYYLPARNGEGVLVEIGQVGARRVLFLTWYTYKNGLQRWIAGNVDYASGATEVTVPLVETSGGQFGAAFNPSNVQVTSFGSATISFPSCTSMRFQWSEIGGQSGTYAYQRLVDGLEGIACP